MPRGRWRSLRELPRRSGTEPKSPCAERHHRRSSVSADRVVATSSYYLNPAGEGSLQIPNSGSEPEVVHPPGVVGNEFGEHRFEALVIRGSVLWEIETRPGEKQNVADQAATVEREP